MIGGKLRVSPNLPEAWDRLAYRFCWQGQEIHVEAEKDCVTLVNATGKAPVTLEVWGREYTFADRLTVER